MKGVWGELDTKKMFTDKIIHKICGINKIASVNKISILARRLGTRLSFYEV